MDQVAFAAEREEGALGCGRRGWGDGGRIEQGDEAEEGPSHEEGRSCERWVSNLRARSSKCKVAVQGVQRLSAREEAL